MVKNRNHKSDPTRDVIEWELLQQLVNVTPDAKRSTAKVFERWAELARRAADLDEGKLPLDARN